MSDALGGLYNNVKYLTSIGVARVTIDIDMDDWERHSSVLGNPPSQDGAKKYVAITRVTEEAFKKWAAPLVAEERGPETRSTREVSAPTAAEGQSQDKPRTRSNIAAIKCKEDEEFQIWLAEKYPAIWDKHYFAVGRPDASHEAANRTLKEICGISSKKELDVPGAAQAAWDKLLASYDYRDRVK